MIIVVVFLRSSHFFILTQIWSMKGQLGSQIVTFNVTKYDDEKLVIHGVYWSINPGDAGTFELRATTSGGWAEYCLIV